MRPLIKRATLCLAVLIVTVVCGLFILVKFNPQLARTLYYKVDRVIHKDFYDHLYLGSSFAITNLSTSETTSYRDAQKAELPASLAKLFVIDYVLSMTDAEEQVAISPLAVSMQKEGSSSAGLVAGDILTIKDLLYAALLPSGNDAAYALAIYCGSKLDAGAQTDEQRYQTFMDELNAYIREQGYQQTVIKDASGYDLEATSSAQDVTNVTTKLLKNPLFKEVVSQSEYQSKSLTGKSYTWTTTNQFMQTQSPYYTEQVKGVKTGSLNGRFNLCIYFISNSGDPYLLVSFGSDTDDRRYVDVQNLLREVP